MIRLSLYDEATDVITPSSPVRNAGSRGLAAWRGITPMDELTHNAGPSAHIPVLLDEVMGALGPKSGGLYIDGTVGMGGHAAGLLRTAGPGARLLGLDADPDALARAAQALQPFGDAALLEVANFRHLLAVAEDLGFGQVDGILLDLGVSSLQLDSAERGFTFRAGGPLDMRFNPLQGLSARDIVNSCPESALADLIYKYGEEPASRRIARQIVAARPVASGDQLAAIVARTVGRRRGIHPATRTFQALRIAVNDEMGALKAVLPQALALLQPGGRLAVISFHSLEDRIVKQFLQQEASGCICPPSLPVCVCEQLPRLEIVTRRPVRPTLAEVARNPRARSAVLRVAEKLP